MYGLLGSHLENIPKLLHRALCGCLPTTGPPGASVHLPVVVSIIPVVKVHQKAIVHHVSHCGNTDQGRVHSVHGFELHAHLEAWGSLVLAGERGRAFSELQSQLLPYHFPCLLQGGTCPNSPKTRPSLTSRQAWDHSGSQKGSALLCMQGKRMGENSSAWPHKERGKVIFRLSGSSISSKFQAIKPLQLTLDLILSQNTSLWSQSSGVSSKQCLRHSRRSWDGALVPSLPSFLGSRIRAKHCIRHTGGVVAKMNSRV